MKKFSLLPLIIIVAVFLAVPVTFWALSSSKNSSDDVRGVKTGVFGLIIEVSSKNGFWDMSEYLCKDREECLESLQSGKFLEKTSGGGVDDQYVTLRYSSDWGSYQYLKIYVEPGWGSMERDFNASLKEHVENSSVEKLNSNGNEYEIVLVPTAGLDSNIFDVARFSDN